MCEIVNTQEKLNGVLKKNKKYMDDITIMPSLLLASSHMVVATIIECERIDIDTEGKKWRVRNDAVRNKNSFNTICRETATLDKEVCIE